MWYIRYVRYIMALPLVGGAALPSEQCEEEDQDRFAHRNADL